MDYIIETHVMQNNKTNFQSRIFCYKSFEEYIKRLKNNESFVIRDIFGNNMGNSIPRNVEIEILEDRLDLDRFVFKFYMPHMNQTSIVYLQRTFNKKINNINRRI